ncbi:MAG: hypothetical protein J6I40_01530, partial [Mailhella sp.]|nr:hypothetical protein [Mailhella sp.]
MSKTPVFLAAACTALLLASGTALVLLLCQSWEDGKRLELQNRELQASLEASRVRIENFCDYPAEAICPVDTTYGSSPQRPAVASEMNPEASGSYSLPEPQSRAEDQNSVPAERKDETAQLMLSSEAAKFLQPAAAPEAPATVDESTSASAAPAPDENTHKKPPVLSSKP